MRKKEDTLTELGKKGKEVMEQLEPKGKKTEAGRSGRQEVLERTTKVTVRLPVDLVKAFKHRAIDENKTFQDLVAEAMREYLKR